LQPPTQVENSIKSRPKGRGLRCSVPSKIETAHAAPQIEELLASNKRKYIEKQTAIVSGAFFGTSDKRQEFTAEADK
jgi:hypothetical protein